MKRLSSREAAALSKLDKYGDAENRREQWWHLMPVLDRQRAMSLAGLDKARAILPLATFTDAERGLIRLAIESHVHRMGLIAQALHARNTTVHGFVH